MYVTTILPEISSTYTRKPAASPVCKLITQPFLWLTPATIVPHAATGDNSIHNGLALTPTLHRAFDSHLFTVTEDYRVKLSHRFRETDASTYRLKQFEGKEILLPKNPDYWPGKDYLKQHNDRFLSLES